MDKQMSWVNPERLMKLLTEQRDLYRNLRELSARQRNLISGDRPELLLDVLSRRQTIVSRLAQINEQLTPFRGDWTGVYAQLPEETRTAASVLLNEINGMLQVILKDDQEDSALLSARKESVGAAIRATTGARAASVAYGAAPRGPAVGGADFSG